jgi:hypothetical protein
VPQAFPPLGEEYEPFLFAEVCDETNGMALTMNSAIARSGADPWAEAARLAKLPKAAALDALAKIIPNRDGAEKSATMTRLLALLPAQRPAILKLAPESRVSTTPLLVAGALALLICWALATLLGGPSHSSVQPGEPTRITTPAPGD